MDSKDQKMRSEWPSNQQPAIYGQATFSSGYGQPAAVHVQVNTGRGQYMNPLKYPLYFNRWRALFLITWWRLAMDLFTMGPFLMFIMNLQMKGYLYFRFHWSLWLAHIVVQFATILFGLLGYKNNNVNWIYAFFPLYLAYFALRITELTMIFNVDILYNLVSYIINNSNMGSRDREMINQMVAVYMSVSVSVYISFAIDAAIALTAAGLFASKLRQIVRNY